MDNQKKNEAGQEANITIERLSKGPLKGKSIRCLDCEAAAEFLVGWGRAAACSGAVCETGASRAGWGAETRRICAIYPSH